jgi:hypothetical protein
MTATGMASHGSTGNGPVMPWGIIPARKGHVVSTPIITIPDFSTALGFDVTVTVGNSSKARVEIPAALAKVLASVPGYLASPGVPSNYKINMVMPDNAAAELLRSQIEQYADDNNLNAYLPVFVDTHDARRSVKVQDTNADGSPMVDSDGNAVAKIGEDGKAIVLKVDGKPVYEAYTVPANNVSPEMNAGRNVSFRLTARRVKETSAVDTTTVTKSNVKDK